MSRKLRVWFPGASYHITARGNRRSALFTQRKDYLSYLSILEDTRIKHPFILHSYCLMTNHVHLLIETENTHIQLLMKELHSKYAIYFNKEYDLDGHVFQGRYGSKLIPSTHYFLEVSRYIHRNPYEANMVQDLSEYEWSSYPSYLQKTNNPHVDLTKTLSHFQVPIIKNYQDFVEKKE